MTQDENAQDEVKRKFAEALERKKGKGGTQHGAGATGAAAQGARAQAESKRVFRRKSG